MADEEVKTLAVKLALEDATFQQGMRSLKQQLGVASSEFDAAGGKIKGFGQTLDGVKAHAQALSDKIKTMQQIESQYKSKLQETQATLQKQSETMMKNKAAMEQANAEYQKNLETLGKDNEQTKASKQALDEQTDAYKRSEAQVRNSEKSVNGYTIQMNEATGKIKAMQAELSKSTGYNVIAKNLQNVGEKVDNVGQKINGLGEKMMTGITVPIATAAVAVSKLFMDYQNGMAKISTIADTSKISLDELGNGLTSLSDKTGQDLSNLQEAEYQAISSGVDTAKSIQFMGTAAKAAAGGYTDTETSVDGLTTVLNAYNLSADKSNEIANQMMVAQNLGKTTFGEMAKSIGLVADTTANCNMKTQDLFSSLAVETAHGIDTSEAVSGLREALSNVIKPSAEATQQAKELGLQFDASHLKSVGWAEFLKEIAEKTHGNTTEMGKLFGSVQGLNTMITLTSESGLSLFNTSLQDMASNTDYVSDAFDKVNNTSGQEFKKSLNELKNDGIKLGESLTPVIHDLSIGIKGLAGWIEKLTPQERELYEKIAAIVAVAGPAVFVTGKLTSGVGDLFKAGGKTVSFIGDFVKGLKGVTMTASEVIPAATKIGTSIAGIGAAPVALGLAAVAIGIAGIKIAIKEATPYTDELGKKILNSSQSWQDYKKSAELATASQQQEIGQIQNLYKRLQTLVDANGRIVGSKEEVMSISSRLNKLTGKDTVRVIGDEVQGYKDLKKSISDVIKQKTAEIQLSTVEAEAKEAEKRLQDAQEKSAKQLLEIRQREAKINTDEAEASKLGGGLAKIKELQIQQEKDDLKKMDDAYKTSESTLTDYYQTIDKYQQASAAAAQGDYSKVQKILSDMPLKYSKAKGDTVEQLKEQAETMNTIYQKMLSDYKKGQGGITKEMVKAAHDNAQKAATEYNAVGGNMVVGTINGFNGKLPALKAAGKNGGRTANNGLSSTLPLLHATGSSAGNNIVSGLDSKLGAISNAGSSLGRAFANSFNRRWKSIIGLPSWQDIGTDNTPSDDIFSLYNRYGHNASGTDDWQGGFTYINEQGGELVNLPNGTQVIPHDISEKMAQAMGTTFAKIKYAIETPSTITNNKSVATSKTFSPQITVNIHNSGDNAVQLGKGVAQIISNELALQFNRRR